MTQTADAETVPADADAPPEPSRRRPPWTLQRRLILTVVGIVSLILVLVAVVTSAVLNNVLEERLTQQIRGALDRLTIAVQQSPGVGAGTALRESPVAPGTLLLVQEDGGPTLGAVLEFDGDTVGLDDTQISDIAAALSRPTVSTVSLDGLGDFTVGVRRFDGATVVVGISREEISATVGQMLTAMGILTAGGLVLLAAATAWTIRVGLAPLRDVAETATRVSRIPLDQGEVTITQRVPEDRADPSTEVGQVGAALNTLLDHVAASLSARQQNEERMRAFVADASHELRTPLASIRGYSELSLRALKQDPDAAAQTTGPSLERIQAQSLRMTTLVEDLLLLARLDEGQELVHGTVDLTRMAVEAVGDARPAGPDHRWLVDVDETPVVITGDAGRLQQVLANLLANARTHTPSGTSITTSVRHEGSDAVLRVHDDGPGVDPDVASELFERFARADRSRARNTGGTGLGLSIARAIVEAHHGSIRVDSTPGDTTFTVRLPTEPVVATTGSVPAQ
ncbi:putative sensor histidine kinase TcrY [Microbacterium lemovicicum]|uniref:histidine kinase n=1 Tax=Microbacterium lemovicicum TaxID=1072463 RepID=A0A3S9WBF0_9MICO|nr:HAMP domain-containing sensor histidine kinase [Microbacterium lemovicicum]AZS37343.1 putative sensor histidine kinase TcrY [Microbacterium lemovicicum]